SVRFLLLYCFLFSSRRRHTRSKRDWSSDVCSSDLELAPADAKNSVTHQQAVSVTAVNSPALKIQAVTINKAPESKYVPEIIGRRPHVSKNRDNNSGPRKLNTAMTA